MRGFQSTVTHRLHFGLGEIEEIDSLRVTWPDGRVSVLKEVHLNENLVLRQKNALPFPLTPKGGTPPATRNSELGTGN